MAAADRRTSSGLSGRLLREPYRFEFFQAVRLLERLARGRASQPVGGDEPPEREAVRLKAAPSLGFAPAAIDQVRPAPDGADAPPEMVVSFLGLTGPSGALPHHYTTLLLRRARDKDHSLREFLDLFNHRAASLFHRAWEKYRLPAAYERANLDASVGETDPITQGLHCLVGLGAAGLRGRQEVDDEAFLFYGGHFSRDARPASALEEILEDYFRVPVRVQQFEERWLPLETGDRSYLAPPDEREGLNCRLGEDFIVGDRVWDAQSKFRVRVGPLTYAQFRSLVPDGDGLRPLCELTRSYAGPELSFDVQTVLAAGQAPGCRLGGDGARLGWDSWVFAADAPAEADDAVFALDDV
jgi:type VI secretion system protein ImpH